MSISKKAFQTAGASKQSFNSSMSNIKMSNIKTRDLLCKSSKPLSFVHSIDIFAMQVSSENKFDNFWNTFQENNKVIARSINCDARSFRAMLHNQAVAHSRQIIYKECCIFTILYLPSLIRHITLNNMHTSDVNEATVDHDHKNKTPHQDSEGSQGQQKDKPDDSEGAASANQGLSSAALPNTKSQIRYEVYKSYINLNPDAKRAKYSSRSYVNTIRKAKQEPTTLIVVKWRDEYYYVDAIEYDRLRSSTMRITAVLITD